MNSNTIKNISIWNLDYVYSDYGVPITLVKLSTNIFVKKPKEYNKNEVEELLKQYEDDEVANSEENINIVVVMNESFTDYNNCEYINMLQDNIPYFHELQNQENVISGNLHSDAFGGRTANIEYEFLTQNSVAYLPTGSIVYQQYLTKKVDSIVRNMNKMNYTTYGIHTWNKTCYRRNAVYPLLGFDYYFFKEDYDDLKEGLNDYVLDISSYRKIMEIFDNKNEGEKIFSFNVTVQNHKPYDRYDYTEIDYIENKESEINIYLQTEHKSDEALKELIEYFENYNERIILLFFGDHQPNTDIEQIGDDEEYKYQIPYLIWANYDINENQYGDTSTNYLQSILMETAGLPLDSYTNYIIELRKQIPVLTANYYIGNNGIKYLLDDKESPYYEKIKEYEKVVYYKMFDEKVAY
jgi:phosphoglycerol transferase MdoB-like AlkP superfamily enzyme